MPVAATCEALGGVGRCGVGTRSISGSRSTDSGTLPAASRSNMLSETSSIDRRAGAGGSGLFTSEGVDGCCVDEEEPGELGRSGRLGEADNLVTLPKVGLSSSPTLERSPLMSFP
jgi:hypothetical protein